MREAATRAVIVVVLAASVATLPAQSPPGVISGPVGPSPYDVVRGWHKPFSEPGFTFGGNSGVFAESPNRIFVAQRGEYRLPNPVPPAFAGFAGSIGVNVLSATAGRVWKNCLYTLDADGNVKERWTQWDSLCEGSSGPGPHRLRISPYDPEHCVWVVNETFHTIYVFSNDGSKLLKTLGEKNVPGTDGKHFGKPQDVAFLPDGRILIADGLDNHRVMILDKDMNYIGEFGGPGKGPVSSAACTRSPPVPKDGSSRSIGQATGSTSSGRRPIRRKSNSSRHFPASRCRSTSSSTTTASG
jgi:NHL repeat